MIEKREVVMSVLHVFTKLWNANTKRSYWTKENTS